LVVLPEGGSTAKNARRPIALRGATEVFAFVTTG
jgi:hypothetical protein